MSFFKKTKTKKGVWFVFGVQRHASLLVAVKPMSKLLTIHYLVEWSHAGRKEVGFLYVMENKSNTSLPVSQTSEGTVRILNFRINHPWLNIKNGDPLPLGERSAVAGKFHQNV